MQQIEKRRFERQNKLNRLKAELGSDRFKLIKDRHGKTVVFDWEKQPMKIHYTHAPYQAYLGKLDKSLTTVQRNGMYKGTNSVPKTLSSFSEKGQHKIGM